VPSANTLVRWVNENAFAPIVRARPCPTFGRPVHPRGGPRRLRPDTSPHTLRIPPHDGHPVLRSAAKSGFRFTLAVSSFRLRARLGFSIPSLFSGQRGMTPAFGYSAPHLGAGGTSTLLNNALLSAHYWPIRPKPPHRYSRLVVVCPCASLPLCFSLSIDGLVPAVPHKKPVPDSRPLYHQAPRGLVPGNRITPGFDST
jgi:hypothetical protein